MNQKTLIKELYTIRSQALEMAEKATVLIEKAGVQAPASLKNPELKRVLDRRNAKIFNKQ